MVKLRFTTISAINMSVKIVLSVIYFSICLGKGRCSYMGDEKSLSRNIEDLLEGKLKLSKNDLPYAEDELSDFTPKNHSKYDFIVIGAGSAGATIASRLSEAKNFKVLLIEAGGKEYSIFDIPALAVAMQSKSEFSWNYQSESSDDYCLAQKDHKCSFPAGKVMGGGSTINAFLATRGNQRDYDGWAKETGDESWSYKHMLKYFRKLENFHANGIEFNKKYRNKGGPLHISVSPKRFKISEAFIEAGKELGYSEVDYNGPEQIGFGYYQNTMFEGERWSSNRAYLRPNKDRKNLFLTQHSHVHKILIHKVSKRAYGVRYWKNGNIYDVMAKKEIIVSAGGVNSAQLLMLSGIGPKKHLQELDIDVIKDAPVGENLLDHSLYGRQLMFSVNDSSTVEVPNIRNSADPTIKEYINDKSGFLSYGSIIQGISFVNVDNRTNLQPDIRIAFYPGSVWLTKDSVTPDKAPVKAFGIQPMILRPSSRGRVLLRSNNPNDQPKIYPHYLEDPDDIRILIKGIRFGMKIGESNAFKRYGSQYQNFSSDCDVHEIGSDKYWECELRNNIRSVYHYAGTCKMGRENSKSSVVNSQLKVIGIKGLRVADASIMPSNLCAHINIPVIAIGEKAADLIKTDHSY